MVAANAFTVEDIEYRFKLVEENMNAAIDQLIKIEEAAKRSGCQEVLDALNEDIEFGHDFPDSDAS
jgi:hypothetical protein